MGLAASLVLGCRLDESSGNAKDFVGGRTLTNTNTATFAAGKIYNGASFAAASSQYFTVASDAGLVTGNIDFTIASWVNLTTKPGSMLMVAKWATGGAGNQEYLLYYKTVNDRFSFGLNTNGTSQFAEVLATTFGSPSLSTWYFVVGGYDSVNDLIFISVNAGARNTTPNALGMFSGTSNFVLGRNDNNGTPGNYLNGMLDEVFVWKRVLSTAEVTTLYNGGNGLSYDYWEVSDWLASPRRSVQVPALPYTPINPVLNATLLAPYTGVDPIWFPTAIKLTTPTRTLADTFTLPPKPYKLFEYTPSPLPPGPGRSKRTPFIRRWWSAKGAASGPSSQGEDAGVDTDERREKRISDQVSMCLNSLIGQGMLVQVSNMVWTIRGGSRVEARDPSPVDDSSQGVVVGQLWVNTVSKAAFINVDNTKNFAVWRAI